MFGHMNSKAIKRFAKVCPWVDSTALNREVRASVRIFKYVNYDESKIALIELFHYVVHFYPRLSLSELNFKL